MHSVDQTQDLKMSTLKIDGFSKMGYYIISYIRALVVIAIVFDRLSSNLQTFEGHSFLQCLGKVNFPKEYINVYHHPPSPPYEDISPSLLIPKTDDGLSLYT